MIGQRRDAMRGEGVVATGNSGLDSWRVHGHYARISPVVSAVSALAALVHGIWSMRMAAMHFKV